MAILPMSEDHGSIRSSERLLAVLSDLGTEVMRADDLEAVLRGVVARLQDILPVEGVGAVVEGVWIPDSPLVAVAGDLDAETVLGAHRTSLDDESSGEYSAVTLDGGPTLRVLHLKGQAGRLGSLVLGVREAVAEADPSVQLAGAVAGVLATGLYLRFGVTRIPGSTRARRLLLDTMPDPALLLDARGSILEVSTPVTRIFHREHDDLVGTNLLEVVDPDDAKVLSELLAASGASGETFEVPIAFVTPRGGRRRFHLHARWARGGPWLAVLRDYTRHAARDRSRRVLLDHMPRIAVVRTAEELWEQLWEALQELLPASRGIRVYRGSHAALRMVWASDMPPGEQDLVFTLKGWGARFIHMLNESGEMETAAAAFGRTTEEVRGRIMRFFSGRGNPLILDDPDRQLAAFLSSEELDKLRKSRGGGGERFSEILCPVIVEGNLDLLVVILGRPGAPGFSWDEAADAWQLVNLAREVTVRLEASATIEGHYARVRSFRSAMRRVSVATRSEELFEAVGHAALDGTGASGMGVVARLGEEVELGLAWSRGLSEPVRDRVVALVEALEARRVFASEPVLFPSVGADELLAELEVDLSGVEALAVAPLTVRGRLLGAMVLTWPAPRRFPADERAQLEFLAGELALALSNHQLYAAAEESRAELNRIVEAVDEGILSLDRAGKVRFLSGRAAELLGVKDPNPEGKPLMDVVDPEVGRELLSMLSEILQGTGVPGRTIRFGKRLIEIRVWLDPAPEGRGWVCVWTLAEVTGAEERRLLLEEFLRHTGEAVAQLALDGRVLWSNPAAERFLRFLGMDDGTGAFRWLPWDEAALGKLEAGQPVWLAGSRVLPSGVALHWEAEILPLGGGDDFSVLVRVHDVTAERALETLHGELSEARKVAARLREMIVELREVGTSQEDLATAVMMHCGLAGDGDGGSTRAGRALDAIRQATANAAEAMGAFRRLLGTLDEEVERLVEVLPRGAAGNRGEVWILGDRPQRRSAIAAHMRVLGWTPRVMSPGELGDDQPPDLAVIDVASINKAVDLYGTLRERSQDLGILMILAMGGGLEGGALSQDARVRVVESIPDESGFRELLKDLTGTV